MINKNIKFVLANTFFFGVVGSYIGGAILILISTSIFGYSHSLCNVSCLIILPPIIGFIPAALTGLLYSITYIKRKGTGGLIGAFYGFFVMSLIGIFIAFSDPTYDYDSYYNQHIDVMASIKLFLLLSLLGAFCAFVCSKLISKWNNGNLQKLDLLG